MRVKHDNPLVIDIIDQHEVFRKQWIKRKQFYNKNKYEIITMDNYNTIINEESEKINKNINYFSRLKISFLKSNFSP